MCAVSAVTRLGKVLLLAYCCQTAVCATSPLHTYSAVDSTEILRFHAGPRSLVHTAWFRLVYPLSQSLPIFSVAGEVIALRRWGPPRHLEQQVETTSLYVCAVRSAQCALLPTLNLEVGWHFLVWSAEAWYFDGERVLPQDVPSLAVSDVPVHDDFGASAAVAEAYVAVVSSALQPSQAALYYQSGPFACSPAGPSSVSPEMHALSELCAASVLLASWMHSTADSHQRGWGVERGSVIHQPALLRTGRHLLGFDTHCHSPTSMLGLIVATVTLSAISIFLLVKVVLLQRKVRRSSLAILRLLGSQLGEGLEAGDAQALNSFTQDTLVKFMAGAAAAPHQVAPPAHPKHLVHTHCGANGSNLGAGHSTQLAIQTPHSASPAMATYGSAPSPMAPLQLEGPGPVGPSTAPPQYSSSYLMPLEIQTGALAGSTAFNTSPGSASSNMPNQAMSLWGPAAASVPSFSLASPTYSPPSLPLAHQAQQAQLLRLQLQAMLKQQQQQQVVPLFLSSPISGHMSHEDLMAMAGRQGRIPATTAPNPLLGAAPSHCQVEPPDMVAGIGGPLRQLQEPHSRFWHSDSAKPGMAQPPTLKQLLRQRAEQPQSVDPRPQPYTWVEPPLLPPPAAPAESQPQPANSTMLQLHLHAQQLARTQHSPASPLAAVKPSSPTPDYPHGPAPPFPPMHHDTLPQDKAEMVAQPWPGYQAGVHDGQGGQLPPLSLQHGQGRAQGGGNTTSSPSFAQGPVQGPALSGYTTTSQFNAGAEKAAAMQAEAVESRPGSSASSLTLQVPKEQEGRTALLPCWASPASSGWSPATSPFAAMGWGHMDSDDLSSKGSGAAAGISQSSSCRQEPDLPAVAGAGLPHSLSVRSSSRVGNQASAEIAGSSSHASTFSSASHASSSCNSMRHDCSTASVSFSGPRHKTKRGWVLESLLETIHPDAASAPSQDTSGKSLDTGQPEEGHSASVLLFFPLGTRPASPSPSIACNTHPSLPPSQQPAPASPDPPATSQAGLLELMQLPPSSHPDAKKGIHCLNAPTTCPGPPVGTSLADQPRHYTPLAAGSCGSSDPPLSKPDAGAAAAAGEKEELSFQDVWAVVVEAGSKQAGQGTAPAKLAKTPTSSPAPAQLEHPVPTPLPPTPDSGKAAGQARYRAAVLVGPPGVVSAPRPRPPILQVPMVGAALPSQPRPSSPLTPTSPVPSAAITQSCLRATGSQGANVPSRTISLVHSNSCHNNSSPSLVGGPLPFHSSQAQGLSSSPPTSRQDSTWLQASDGQPQQAWLPSSSGRKVAFNVANDHESQDMSQAPGHGHTQEEHQAPLGAPGMIDAAAVGTEACQQGKLSPVFIRARSMVDSTSTDTSLWQSTDLNGHLSCFARGPDQSSPKYLLPLGGKAELSPGHQAPQARSRLSISSMSLLSGEPTGNIDWPSSQGFSGSAYDGDDGKQEEGAEEEDAGDECRLNSVALTQLCVELEPAGRSQNAATLPHCRTEPYAHPQDAASLPCQLGDGGRLRQQGACASVHGDTQPATPSFHNRSAQRWDGGKPLTTALPRRQATLPVLRTRSSNSIKINSSRNVPPTGLSSPSSHIALPQDTSLLRPGRVSTSGSCDAPYSKRSPLYRQLEISSGMLVAPQTHFTSSAHLATLSSSLASTAAPSSQGACSPAHLSRQVSRQSRTSLAGNMGVERVMTMARASFSGRGGDDVQAALGVLEQLLVEHADSITTPVEGIGPEAEIDVVDVVNDPVLPDVSLDINLEEEIVLDSDKPLGTGAYGAVYSGQYRGLPVAVKFANKGMLDGLVSKAALDTLNVETRILSRVRHPNIVRFYGGCIRPPVVFLVEELLLSDLSELVHNNNLLPLDDVLRIGKDIASGLFHLHPTIIHRDLKPANVLLDHRGQAKIGDFGMARFKLQAALVTKDNNAGTMAYMAPECFHNNTVTPKADVYSWAIIMWEMLTGQLPWLGCNNAAIIGAVAFKGERPDLPDSPQRCPPDLTALITECWQQDPRDRPSTGELVKSISLIMKVRQHHHRQPHQAPEEEQGSASRHH